MFLDRSVNIASGADMKMPRSVFNYDPRKTTTFNSGKLELFKCEEVLPGDTWSSIKSHVYIRLTTPKVPVMDDLWFDMYWFFVPMRLTWDHSKQFFGENDVDAGVLQTEYTKPYVTLKSACYKDASGTNHAWAERSFNPSNNLPYSDTTTGFTWATREGTTWERLGLPVWKETVSGGKLVGMTKNDALSFDAELPIDILPFRGYHLIWNNYFRSQDLQDPFVINKGDNAALDLSQEGFFALHPVSRLHDYFSDCLPYAQKGDDVLIPGLLHTPVDFGSVHDVTGSAMSIDGLPGDNPYSLSLFATSSDGQGSGNLSADFTQEFSSAGDSFVINNAELGLPVDATISALRTAVAIQRYREKLLFGSRYREYVANFFGASIPDNTVQIPEYLGHQRFHLNMSQVVQTSSTDATTPQGNVAGISATAFCGAEWTRSFSEHGYLYCVGCVRADATYQNNIPAMFSRVHPLEIYNPQFANISNQPVRNGEIYVDLKTSGTSATGRPSDTFGFQDAWESYRQFPNSVSGKIRSEYIDSLDVYTYADDYNGTVPTLSSSWMNANSTSIGRALAVSNQPQLIMSLAFTGKVARVMPVHSTPGLMDHAWF